MTATPDPLAPRPVPDGAQVAPPSVLRAIPVTSPEPAARIRLGFDTPTEKEAHCAAAMPALSGDQVAPSSSLRKTPWECVPTSNRVPGPTRSGPVGSSLRPDEDGVHVAPPSSLRKTP